jgi:hypothetical protein
MLGRLLFIAYRALPLYEVDTGIATLGAATGWVVIHLDDGPSRFELGSHGGDDAFVEIAGIGIVADEFGGAVSGFGEAVVSDLSVAMVHVISHVDGGETLVDVIDFGGEFCIFRNLHTDLMQGSST